MKKIYYNGDIITMEKEGHYIEALLIEDGKIKLVGDKDKVFNEKDDYTEIVDLKGRTLMPSFIDSHSHFSMLAYNMTMVDLSKATSFDDIVKLIKEFKEKNNLNNGEYIMGYGYDHNVLEEREHPTKDILDKISISNPIYISHISGHMGVGNSEALKFAGMNKDTPDLEGGVIGRYKDTGELNGYVEEAGMIAIRMSQQSIEVDMPTLSIEAQQEYLKYGITTVQDGASSKEMVQLYQYLDSKDLLDIDVVAYPLISNNGEEVIRDNKNIVNKYLNHFKIGGYKMILDGSPQGKSAWLSEPYEGEEEYRGYPWLKNEEVEKYCKIAVEDNVQILAHSNGDAASEQFLNSYEKALIDSENENKYNLRPVMIHCQTVREDQLDRMAKINMIPSIFVDHTYYWGDIHLNNLGEVRGNKISPVRTALDKGLVVNFHQDTPVLKPNMFQTIWAATNRVTRGGKVIGEDEKITVYEAMKAVTINAAYEYFEENEKGSIRDGKRADLIILDQNPLKIDKRDIKDIIVLQTIKDGREVYSIES